MPLLGSREHGSGAGPEPAEKGDVYFMNIATAAEESTSETRLRVVPSWQQQEFEAEAWEVLAQLEVLQRRAEDGDNASGAPASMLAAMVKKLRAAMP